jgi:hypothetical protein
VFANGMLPGLFRPALFCSHLPAFREIVRGRLHDELADDLGFREMKVVNEVVQFCT